MGLRIKMKKHNGVPVMLLSGAAVGEDVRKVSEKINRLAEGDSSTVVIDLSDLDSVDSNGLGMFVFSWKLLDSQQKKLLFLNPTGFVKNLFEGSNLHKVFTIIDTLEGL
jgi:anti-sigma B factor antagonist